MADAVIDQSAFWARLKPWQEQIESALRHTLEQFTTEAPPQLREAMAYSLLAPGKRLRPLLVALTCQAAGGTLDAALPAAVAVEMIHTYSLIHDDLPAMDDDDLRRGRPTCHVVYGEALAILAGDALLTLAFEVLGQSYPAAVAAICCVELARGAGASGMVAGQVLDMAMEAEPADVVQSYQEADLEAIHRRKTGALIRAAVLLGHTIGTTALPPAEAHRSMECFARYAENLGLAFQVTDDLLDVQSTAEKLGKRTGKDAARGKLTYPTCIGIMASEQKARDLIAEARTALALLGRAAEPLDELARFVLARTA
jgi:geranylgeranyl diphosphate synthase type II